MVSSKSNNQRPLSGLNIYILTPGLENNSTGRAFVIWEIARNCGADIKIFSIAGNSVWKPLAGNRDFCQSCSVVIPEKFVEIAAEADLIISIKPYPESLGVALSASKRHGIPLLADIDDPDLDYLLRKGRPLERLAKIAIKPKTMFMYFRLQHQLSKQEITVSNPFLQGRYGGTLIPHTREDTGAGVEHTNVNPQVAFIGTNRPHKGLEVLRRAVAIAQDVGATLVVTDSPPIDAKPWEKWIGQTSLEEGIETVKSSDIISIPSSARSDYSKGQLPAKLIDGMIAGRAIIVSDIDPLPWAVSNTGIIVNPDDSEELANAIRYFSPPPIRKQNGTSARERALSMFTVEAVSIPFVEACRRAMFRKQSTN